MIAVIIIQVNQYHNDAQPSCVFEKKNIFLQRFLKSNIMISVLWIIVSG